MLDLFGWWPIFLMAITSTPTCISTVVCRDNYVIPVWACCLIACLTYFHNSHKLKEEFLIF